MPKRLIEPMPVSVATWLIRVELKRIEYMAGPNVRDDIERAITTLIEDAIDRHMAKGKLIAQAIDRHEAKARKAD